MKEKEIVIAALNELTDDIEKLKDKNKIDTVTCDTLQRKVYKIIIVVRNLKSEHYGRKKPI